MYIINRSPSSSIDFEVPEALLSGGKPEYDLRSFGCVAYVHSVGEKITPRATKGIFIGYAQGTKGYRIWLLEDQKVTISKDVVFHEEQLYKDLTSKTSTGNESVESSKTNKRVTFSSNLEEVISNKDLTEESSSKGGISSVQELSESETETETGIEEADDTEMSDEEIGAQNLDNYLLARDREKRTSKAPSRFEDANYLTYALASSETINLPKVISESQEE